MKGLLRHLVACHRLLRGTAQVARSRCTPCYAATWAFRRGAAPARYEQGSEQGKVLCDLCLLNATHRALKHVKYCSAGAMRHSPSTNAIAANWHLAQAPAGDHVSLDACMHSVKSGMRPSGTSSRLCSGVGDLGHARSKGLAKNSP